VTAYAAAIPRPPRTLTELEQATLLKVTGEHRSGYRDVTVRHTASVGGVAASAGLWVRA
jgi:hypothetical protein